MKINIQKICPLLLFLVCSKCESITKTDIKSYLLTLTNFIETNSTNYQVVILINNRTQSFNQLNEIINEILSKVPGLVINSSAKTNKHLITLPIFDEPRKTSLFILIDNELRNNSSKSNIIESIKFLRALSPNRIRPKCIIILFSIRKEILHKELLIFMWSKFFLDTTIFQLDIIIENANKFFNYYKFFDASLHSFNPFTGEYKKQKFFQKKIEWFPNKLDDMNGYKLITGAYFSAPYSQLKFNATGDLIHYWGADFVALDALSKAMNFSYTVVSSINASIGVIDLKNNTAGGMLGKCVRNEIDILLTTVLFSRDSKRSVTEFTRMINWENVYAIVPILQGEKKIVENTTLYKTFIFFILVVFIFHIITRLFGYDQLDYINIIAILSGVTVQNQSTSIHERLFFISIVILGFLCGTIFFAGFTHMNMQIFSNMEFNTFDDFDRSGLIPIIHVNMFDATFSAADGVLLKLKEKTKTVTKDCIPMILNDVNKTISCIKPSTNVVAAIELSKNGSGRPTLTALKQKFWGFRTVMNLGRGSPYVEKINKLIIRLTESGLRNKWNEPYSFADTLIHSKSQDSSDIDDFGYVENLLQCLLFVIFNGYLISFVVFLIEVFVDYFSRFIFGFLLINYFRRI